MKEAKRLHAARNHWRWTVLFSLLAGLLLVHSAYAHLAVVQAKRLTVRGKPAVQLLIQTDQGAGKEIIVRVGSNVIIFRTDARGRVDTGHVEVPEGATSVVVKMPDPGDELWPAECTIPLAEIPQGRYERVAACMDLEPPVTRFSQEPEKNRYGWNNSPVEVTLWTTDEKSGVKQICYELSGAISQPERCTEGNQVSFTIPESPNGTTTVRFFAEDRWVDQGIPKPNREEPKTAEVRIDTGPPSISASLSPEPNEHGWNNEPVHVSFRCSDSLSGIASCTGDRTVRSEGARQAVTGYATDRAGNTDSKTLYVNIDLTKPVIRQAGSPTCSQPGNNGWCRGVVTVPFEASDALSGFAGGEHTIRFTKSTSREGDAVYVPSGTVEDLAGNEADPISAGPFKIDHTPPVVQLFRSPSPNANGWNRGEVTVTVTATDEEGGSGIAAIYYKIGTRSPVEVGKGRLTLSEGGRVASYSLTIRDEGTHHLGFWAVDQAGNESEHQALTVKIDPTKPSISVSLSPTSVYPGDCIRVTIRASDGLSGIDSVTASDSNLGHISLSRSGSEWRGTIYPKRSGRVTVTARDKAGNTSSDSASYTVKTRPAFFEVTGLSISPSRPEVGETVTIEARIRNTGGSRDRQKVILYIDGYRVNSKYITLDPGESEWVRFHYAFSTSGTHHVVIRSEDDHDEDWIEVIPRNHPPQIERVTVIDVSPGYHGFARIEVAISFYDGGRRRSVCAMERHKGSYKEYRHIDVSDQVSGSYGVIVLEDEDSLPLWLRQGDRVGARGQRRSEERAPPARL